MHARAHSENHLVRGKTFCKILYDWEPLGLCVRACACTCALATCSAEHVFFHLCSYQKHLCLLRGRSSLPSTQLKWWCYNLISFTFYRDIFVITKKLVSHFNNINNVLLLYCSVRPNIISLLFQVFYVFVVVSFLYWYRNILDRYCTEVIILASLQ